MIIRKACPDEYLLVRNFYYQLIDDMEGRPYHPKWQKGIYPEDSYLKAAIEAGELMVGEIDNRIAAAMIVNQSASDGYVAVCWPTAAAQNEVTLIHALGVGASYMGQGIGRAMVQAVICAARDAGQKAVRLDVLVGNEPARRLYEGIGFCRVQRVNMFYEDTGWCDFDLYEFPLC